MREISGESVRVKWMCSVIDTCFQPRPMALRQQAGLQKHEPGQPPCRQMSTASGIAGNAHGAPEQHVRIDAQAPQSARTG